MKRAEVADCVLGDRKKDLLYNCTLAITGLRHYFFFDFLKIMSELQF